MHWQSATATLLQPFLDKPRRGLLTDVDGTISHIVRNPDEATVTGRSRSMLDALRQHLTLVAVLSGRSAADTRRMLNLPALPVVGNHGLEWWLDGQPVVSPEVAEYRPALEHALKALSAQQVPGVLVEDKGATLTVHYRQTQNPQAIAAMLSAVLQKVAREQNLRVFPGRMIFELRPPVDINKGTAFRELVRRYHLDAALYLGDDVTDVDALLAARRLRERGECYAVGLGVESDDMPAGVRDVADLLCAGVQDVEAFLAWLLSAVSASST